MKKPNQIGVYLIEDIDIKEVIPFIDWRFYFTAWRLPGRYEGIEKVHDCPGCEAAWLQGFEAKDREKASEALNLFRDICRFMNMQKKTMELMLLTGWGNSLKSPLEKLKN